MHTFIDEYKINSLLDKSATAAPKEALSIIEKAKNLKGLSPKETAILLQSKDPVVLQSLYAAARFVKEQIYGKRLVIFAPLYITSYCVNNCLYCGFRCGNKHLARKRLSLEEIQTEVQLLEKEGHKRILLVAGEDPKTSNINFLEKVIPTIYATHYGNGEIRRINVNVAAMSVAHFRRLKKTGIGTYQLFQETYHLPTYKKAHLSGPKANYRYHLYAMHRAQTAGISDVGLGVLFGLYDYKFEVLALLYHALELEKQFGAGPHTISIPRIEPALGAPLTKKQRYTVSDTEFKKLVAILRLAVPYTGLILSTRESARLRNEIFGLGISQISAGSRTTPGGYQAAQKKGARELEQFSLHDARSLAAVIKDIARLGYSPSFCTACYRLGRTGKDFMDLAKPGLIQAYCLPNSLLTFKEYLLDYGDKSVQKIGAKTIQKHLADIKNLRLRKLTQQKLRQMEKGQRDLYC